MSERYYGYYQSSIGLLEVVGLDSKLLQCNFVNEKSKPNNEIGIIQETIKQLDEYFNLKRKIFDFELLFEGTIFQKKVWNELLKIPFGKTISYKELAKIIGNVKAIRAVGSANAKNPISVIVPCHRIIGSDGKLRGYGGGIDKKKWLIDFEKRKM